MPRLFTPPLRRLTRKTTLGFSVIDFAEGVLEITLLPWQKWLLVHALELLADGSLRFRTVVVLVARQNGKSTLSQILALWFMFVYGFALVIGTAQDLDVAEEIWQGAVDLVEETPDLNALKDRVVKVNGKKSLELKAGQRYKVKAANRRAGRGLSGDLILLDELREHQSWDSWAAIMHTTIARAVAMVWALSNAGDALSIVLRHLRKLAHAALGDPDGINVEDTATPVPDEDTTEFDPAEDTLGLFEWSAPPGVDIMDRDGWAQANPALGHTITERTLASAARTDPEWVFRTEVLCQWSDGTLEGPFPPGSWEACRDVESRIADTSALSLCVDVSWDRTTSHVAIAGWREDGRKHVEVIASRAGTEWVAPWLKDPDRLWVKTPDRRVSLTWQASGAPVSSLNDDLLAVGLPVTEWSGANLARACGNAYDEVRQGVWRMRPQPVLDRAASSAVTKPMGDGAWVFDRKKSPLDCSPLNAGTGAAWALGQVKAPVRSRYEDEGAALVMV